MSSSRKSSKGLTREEQFRAILVSEIARFTNAVPVALTDYERRSSARCAFVIGDLLARFDGVFNKPCKGKR